MPLEVSGSRGRKVSASPKHLVALVSGKLYGQVSLMDAFLDRRDAVGADIAVVYTCPDFPLTDPRAWAMMKQAASEGWLRVVLWPPPSIYAEMAQRKHGMIEYGQVHANLDAILRL